MAAKYRKFLLLNLLAPSLETKPGLGLQIFITILRIAPHQLVKHEMAEGIELVLGYKQMLLDSQPEEIVYTEKISGIPANWLGKSVAKIDMEKLDSDQSLEGEFKRWRDIWSAGHGVAQIHEIIPAAQVVENMAKEYVTTIKNLPSIQ